jgi:lipopolysaccharide export system permease protein
VSFYSLGYSRVDILKPFVFVSTFVIAIFIYLHSFSSFSRADEFSNNIRKNAEYLSPTRDLFFTYKDKYVFFNKMIPLQEKALGVRVFEIKDKTLKEILVAKEAYYRDGAWRIDIANIIKKPKVIDFNSKGIVVKEAKGLKILQGFRPKMLDQVYEGKVNFTIKNAIDAILLLNKQGIDISSIKGALYRIFVYPFFVPCLVVIIFFFVPMSPRFLNVSLFSFGAILFTLLVWGVLFALIELSTNKTIPSEVGVVLPIIVLFIVASIQYTRHYRR